jgi:hypothetical protein
VDDQVAGNVLIWFLGFWTGLLTYVAVFEPTINEED